jgi:hypothetical protein
MENEEVVMQMLEQVQELQERLQEVLEDQSPPHDPETHHQNQSHQSMVQCSRAC